MGYKTDLKYHIIFVCKYRKRLLIIFGEFVKNYFSIISQEKDFKILLQEVDQDHIHLMIESKPIISITSIVRYLKQKSVYALWQEYPVILRKEFWEEKTFWSDGYFACSIGNASEETIKKYIESQG